MNQPNSIQAALEGQYNSATAKVMQCLNNNVRDGMLLILLEGADDMEFYLDYLDGKKKLHALYRGM